MCAPAGHAPHTGGYLATSQHAVYAAARHVLAERLWTLERSDLRGASQELRRALLTALPDALATGDLTRIEPIAVQLGMLAQHHHTPLATVVANAHHFHDDTMDAIIGHITQADQAGLVALFQVSRVLRDLTEAVLSSYQDASVTLLTEQAFTDGLTGLANRRAFDARLDDELRRAQRLQHPVAVILLDIDGLKRMNDAHGHAHGDVLLRIVALVLREQARGIDVVARIGGDEFAVLLPEADQDGANALAQRLAQAVSERQVDGAPVRVSTGAAVYPDDGATAPALVQCADHRMYTAKRAAKRRAGNDAHC